MFYFHPLFGEGSHFDSYVSKGLVQPPTRKNIFFSPKKVWYLHEMFVVERLPPPWSQLRPSPIRNPAVRTTFLTIQKQLVEVDGNWGVIQFDFRRVFIHGLFQPRTSRVFVYFVILYGLYHGKPPRKNTICGIGLFFFPAFDANPRSLESPTLLQKHLHEKYHEMCNESGEHRYLVFTRCQYALLPRKLT